MVSIPLHLKLGFYSIQYTGKELLFTYIQQVYLTKQQTKFLFSFITLLIDVTP